MKVLLTGAAGQLGSELAQTRPDGVALVPTDADELDITHDPDIQGALDKHRPDVVINAAAYTAVDRAESEAEVARAVNAGGAADLADACADRDVRMIHVSTDFVFDGSHGRPWRVDDPTNPLGVYGQTKADGERAVLAHPGHLVVRTSWLYSNHGPCFVATMLRLMGERDRLTIVADQIGTPTWTRTLASALWAALEHPDVTGVLHWSDAGAASWYDFARAIYEEAREVGLFDRDVDIVPIRSEDYPTPAKRPHFSVLDAFDAPVILGVPRVHWRSALRAMLRERVASAA